MVAGDRLIQGKRQWYTNQRRDKCLKRAVLESSETLVTSGAISWGPTLAIEPSNCPIPCTTLVENFIIYHPYWIWQINERLLVCY